MALTDDQKALLRLLAQREEGYEDIAALMGLSVDEVRTRVRGALAAMQQEQGTAPDRASPPPEPAAPEPAAPESSPPAASEPEPPRPAAAARPPEAPPASASPPSPDPASRKRPSLPRPKLPSDRRRLAEIVGGVLVAILVVLFAVGVIDIGGGDSDDSAANGGAAQGQAAANGGEQEPTQARLTGVGANSGAQGFAAFGRSGQDVVLVFGAEGLRKSPQGRSYAISLVKSPTEKIPIAAAEANAKGQAAGQYQIAPNVLGLLANDFDTVEVELVVNKELRTALKQAQESESPPEFSGEPALRGPVTGPIVDLEAEGEGE